MTNQESLQLLTDIHSILTLLNEQGRDIELIALQLARLTVQIDQLTAEYKGEIS